MDWTIVRTNLLSCSNDAHYPWLLIHALKMNEVKQRFANLDFLKIVAIYFVIVLHAMPIMVDKQNSLIYGILNNIARFAVPCFFIMSGYFAGEKIIQNKLFFKTLKRILVLFLFWNFFYLMIPLNCSGLQKVGYLRIKYWDFYQIVTHPCKVLLQGFYGHLWYLESLALAFVYLFLTSKISIKFVFGLALIQYIICVLGGGYSETGIGFHMPFTSRNGPFASALFVSLGWYFSITKLKLPWQPSLLLVGIGFFTQYFEYILLTSKFPRAIHYEFMFGTPIMAVGVFLLFLGFRSEQSFFSNLGNLSLGVYVLHVLVLDHIRYAIDITHLSIDNFMFFVLTVFVYLLSIGFSFLFSINSRLKLLVT
ncbi:MAG: acyltransferase [Methylococcaceae bacterium]|nr:acyltransferase [Methylococcaceae bacterium]